MHFLCFLLVILLLIMAPNYSAEMLSSVSKHKKAVMCLVGKIPVLGKLYSTMSYRALGCELNDNERTLSIKEDVFKQTHT